MRILVVNLFDIDKLPPVRSLVENLLENDHKVTLISYGNFESKQKINLNYIQIEKFKSNNITKKMLHFYTRKKRLRKLVNEQMKSNDILWTTTDLTVRELGNTVLRYKHIMQLMELINDIPAVPYQKIIKTNLKRYAKSAWKVVVPEYNRAHIVKTWWGLKTLPSILPNKPYRIELENISENIVGLEDIRKEKRKIILYQGIFRKERRLDEFARAVSMLGDKYCLYIMGEDNEISRELCEKYTNIVYIPFIAPPHHLLVTKYAYIGLMPYIPGKNHSHHISELNELYCAPNKIYEYSAFGLPMIGTKVPGLEYPFNLNGIGVSSELCADDIIIAINKIEANYDQIKKNSYNYFKETDLDKIVQKILYEEEY